MGCVGCASRGNATALSGRVHVLADLEPPDSVHMWLTTAQAAELLGVSVVAVNKRCRRERLPYVEKAGRRWIRLDLLEQVERARAAQERRSPV